MIEKFVLLESKRNRGWPNQSDYRDVMFGETGWCRACGVPNHAQTGPLVLRRSGLTVSGAWVPYWQYDTICMDVHLADQVIERFDVDLRPVSWSKSPPGDAFQMVIPTVGEVWFDPTELTSAVMERHGKHHDQPGARCAVCGVWRWFPPSALPNLRAIPSLGDVVIAASPEWFGDGWNAFRQVIVRRDLAELIAEASPRDFVIKNVRS